MLQEYCLSDFDFVFFGSVSVVMVTLQFLLLSVVSLPDIFHVCLLCWVVVKFGTDCSVHE